MKRGSSLALAAVLLCAPASWGYIRYSFSYSDGTSAPVKRSDATGAGVQFYVNNLIAAGLVSSGVTTISTNSDPLGAIRAAAATWNVVPNTALRFLPIQTTLNTINPSDGKNTIAIGSTPADLSALGGAFAFTVLTGAPSIGGVGGDVSDSDVILNPALNFSTDYSTSIDLQAVVTHELGHSLGLNHSSLVGGGMFQFSYLPERFLSTDENSFAAGVYPAGSSALGTLSGKVVAADGSAVQAGLVTALDTIAGTSLCALTAQDGSWSVQAPAGSYVIYADAMTGTSLVQPGNLYLTTAVKVTTNFQATMLGGFTSPTVVNVTAGAATVAPNLTVTAGATTLTPPFAGVGKAAGTSDIRTFTNTALIVPSGQSVDIGLSGAGIDNTISVKAFGRGITVQPGLVVDHSTLNGQAIIRVTIAVAAQTTPSLASFIVTKGSNVLAMTGFLVIVPPTPVISSVQDAESARASIVPGEWVAIYGSNLATGVNVWGNSDFVNGTLLPVTLSGVRVQFNGSPAPVYVATSGQINAQAPSGLSGNVSVVVTNNGSPSAAFSATAVPIAPSFFIYPAGGNLYPAAVHLSGALVGDPAVQPGSVKASPGETIIFFVNGLASSPAGSIIGAAQTYTSPVTVNVGSASTTASFAGLVAAGEYQLNVTIPTGLAAGSYPISVTTQGQSSPSGVTLVVGP